MSVVVAGINKRTVLPLKKYNVDVISFLKEEILRNTEHYQTDFDADMRIIAKVAQTRFPKDKMLLWMSRLCGTWWFTKHNVFVKGSFEHNTWIFYAEQTSDNIVAYAIEITGMENSVVRGNVYELDYRTLESEVLRISALPMDERKVFAEDIFSFKMTRYVLQKAIEEHGEVIRSVSVPHNLNRLDDVLTGQALKRMG